MIKGQQRVLELLRQRGTQGATTEEIGQLAQVATSLVVAEIRKSGFQISRTYQGRCENRRPIHVYRLLPSSWAKADEMLAQVPRESVEPVPPPRPRKSEKPRVQEDLFSEENQR